VTPQGSSRPEWVWEDRENHSSLHRRATKDDGCDYYDDDSVGADDNGDDDEEDDSEDADDNDCSDDCDGYDVDADDECDRNISYEPAPG